MHDLDAMPELLLGRARAGDEPARGHLLELYRNYLRLIARSLVGQALQARVDPSDLVQETYLEAHRDFPRFAGSGERELVAWLRQILVRNLANLAKHHRAQRRDVRRQEPIEVMLDRSSLAIQEALAAPISSPSAAAVRRERSVLLADALASLPEDYRDVFIRRNVNHETVEQIAEAMGRSANAVRKLWARALIALKGALEDRS